MQNIVQRLLLPALAGVALASPVLADESADRSGTFECQCSTSFCTYDEGFRITYDKDRQFITAEGPSWKYSGYVTRQESKTTGAIYLVLPRGYTVMSSQHLFTLQPDGEVRLDGEDLTCKRL